MLNQLQNIFTLLRASFSRERLRRSAKQIAPYCLALALTSMAQAEPDVSNIAAQQRPASNIVDITYDLENSESVPLAVTIEGSIDGVTWEALSAVAGDVGNVVFRGANKRIIWDAGSDWAAEWFPKVKVRITADDGLAANRPTLGPAHYYNFDLDASDRAGDIDGVTNTQNGPDEDAIAGNSLAFDGVDDTVAYGETSALFGLTEATVSLWVKPNSYGYISLLSNADDEVYDMGDFELIIWSPDETNSNYGDGTLYVGGADADGNEVRHDFDANIPLNLWTHLALVIKTGSTEGDTTRLYVNGREITEKRIYGDSVDWASAFGDSSSVLSLGSNGTGQFYSGKIDDFKIFDRAIAESEIAIMGNARASYGLIPAGDFVMGSPDSEPGRDLDETVHIVEISDFYFVGRTEVTNALMAEILNWAFDRKLLIANETTVMNAEGDQRELLDLDDSNCQISFDGSLFSVDIGKEQYPCLEVSWYGALAYCYYLTEKEGLLAQAVDLNDWSVDFTQTGYRLPTEAEWEHACRGGNSAAFYTGALQHLGSSPLDPNLHSAGWYLGNSTNPDNEILSEKGSFPVGVKAQNNFGLRDMHGNVQEWCWDWYQSACGEDFIDPRGPPSGSTRVLRGGSWINFSEDCRSAKRSSSAPAFSGEAIGFRVVHR